MSIIYTPKENHYLIQEFLIKKEKYNMACSLYQAIHYIFDNDKTKNIDGYATKERIAWVKNKVFAEFKIYSKKLVIHTAQPIENIKKLGQPIPKTHLWSNNLTRKFELTNNEDIGYIINFLNEAYKKAQ